MVARGMVKTKSRRRLKLKRWLGLGGVVGSMDLDLGLGFSLDVGFGTGLGFLFGLYLGLDLQACTRAYQLVPGHDPNPKGPWS